MANEVSTVRKNLNLLMLLIFLSSGAAALEAQESSRTDEGKILLSRLLDLQPYLPEAVQQVFLNVPRSGFLPEAFRSFSTTPHGVPGFSDDQELSPLSLGRILSLIPRKTLKEGVLIRGAGTGYPAALTSRLLADTETQIFAGETSRESYSAHEKILANQPYRSKIRYRYGEESTLWAEEAPFDVILVTTPVEELNNSLISLMSSEAIIIFPMRNEFNLTNWMVLEWKGNSVRLSGLPQWDKK